MWLKWLKISALVVFCFYPWWLISIYFHPWYGPLVAFLFTFIILILLYQIPDLILLSLLRAREYRKAQAEAIEQLLKKVAFTYRIPTPKLFFTYQGTRNVYVLFCGRKQSTVVIHEDCLKHLRPEEMEAIFLWILSPESKMMFKRGTFFNALTSLALLPLMFLFWLLQSLSFLPTKWTDGPKTSLELLTLALVEISHSIFYDAEIVRKTDLAVAKRFGLSTLLISALGKLEQEQKAFNWAEKILLSNRFSQTKYHVRIFSLLNEYNDPEVRIEGLKVQGP